MDAESMSPWLWVLEIVRDVEHQRELSKTFHVGERTLASEGLLITLVAALDSGLVVPVKEENCGGLNWKACQTGLERALVRARSLMEKLELPECSIRSHGTFLDNSLCLSTELREATGAENARRLNPTGFRSRDLKEEDFQQFIKAAPSFNDLWWVHLEGMPFSPLMGAENAQWDIQNADLGKLAALAFCEKIMFVGGGNTRKELRAPDGRQVNVYALLPALQAGSLGFFLGEECLLGKGDHNTTVHELGVARELSEKGVVDALRVATDILDKGPLLTD
jgi:hypothetical protein